MRNLQNYLFFILMLILAGCKKAPDSLSLSDFPLKVGDTWTYQRIDSNTLKIDTVVWSLSGAVSVNGRSMYLWLQTSATQTDTGYWAVNGDTVFLYGSNILYGYSTSDNIIYGPTDYFIFPAQSGSKWSESNLNTYSCSVTSSVIVNMMAYNNVFVLNRAVGGMVTGVEKIDIAKEVGMIFYYTHEQEIGYLNANYQFSLISYNIH